MSQSIQNRVSDALKSTSKPIQKIADEVGVVRKTIYSWRDRKTKKFDDEDLEALASSLGLNPFWLRHGKGPKYSDEQLNRIKSVVNDPSSDYKGPDQTLLNVESKAKSLIQELRSLLDDIQKLKNE